MEDRTNDISECLAACLLNRVLHIWSEEIVAEDPDILSTVEGAPLRGIVAMEEAMSGIEVNDKSAEYSESNGSETIDEDGIKIEEYCLENPWAAGKEKMKR